MEDKDVFAETIDGRAATVACIVDVCDAQARREGEGEAWVAVG